MFELNRTELLIVCLLSPVFQNTAMHLAAINGHPIVVDFLLSNSKSEIVKNANNDNILDIAARSEEREVAAVIAKHDRLVIEWFLIPVSKLMFEFCIMIGPLCCLSMF